jgi:hypothetical protein
MSDNDAKTDTKQLGVLATLIFSSRWLQLPLYLGLIIAQAVYVFLFIKELVLLTMHATTYGEQQIMLAVLGLIDVVMISNLLVMVIVGGYETFVSRLHLQGHPDQPEWLSHVNAGVLKVKLHRDHRHQLDPPAEDLHRSRSDRIAGREGDLGRRVVADHHPHGLHPLGHRHRLGRQDDELDSGRQVQTLIG